MEKDLVGKVYMSILLTTSIPSITRKPRKRTECKNGSRIIRPSRWHPAYPQQPSLLEQTSWICMKTDLNKCVFRRQIVNRI
ncbi:hypothetical protein ANCCAN_19472 [Ancylostoma caninum]|uniref:Uncharacterized protein n=1 Tax=Ancylostoma caninum TaxID=29170 RepID=A0A368FR99_ANCCA|nr:hypothetical protein ANCCAN_19472 [Ancylostoma caninum]